MSNSDDQAIQRVKLERKRCWWTALTLTAVGAAGMVGGAGFALVSGAEGDQATAAGVATGVGFALTLIGAIWAWSSRPGQSITVAASGEGARRDKLERARTQQLVMLPVVLLLFMAQAHQAMGRILGGDHNLGAYVQVLLPVLYGWLIPLVVMGWDAHTRKNRRFLEDELTQLMRARSMILAFVVLMTGLTVALGLGLWRPQYGVMALPYVLALGGASAGLRFAWLDREAGRDG
ncbi:hypothetical protein [Brevundimonas mediterranea]|uniref:Uncharacterized protein n=1 Tax=Brevundimonas mediterranea TaxID=74329 RepID=A0A7W6A801_9CAUL|nr:hypothetical protein [Brevundimonas mediterranea]MBB3873440.1 hypothetical protein [Brevundimonas mediterranea]